MSFGPYAGVKTRSSLVNCAINCTLFIAVPKCPTDAASVPQRRELVTDTRAAGQGPKYGTSNEGSVVGLPDSEPAP